MENEDINIIKKTLLMIDKSMENFKKGIVSDPINLTWIDDNIIKKSPRT